MVNAVNGSLGPMGGSVGDGPSWPAITFAIPYFDNLAYLLEAIDSVRAQTRQDWQLVIVDDAGPEPVDEVLSGLNDARIHWFRNESNLGLAGNWNRCIHLAEAEWVTLLHADDRLHPDYAHTVLEAAACDPELGAIFTDSEIINANGEPARSLPDAVKRLARRPAGNHDVIGDADLAAILSNNYVFCPAICYRTEVARAHPFDTRWRMVMDLEHTAQMLLKGHRLYAIRRPLYQYRRHAGNQTTALTSTSVRFREEITLYRELAATASIQGWTRSARAADRRWMVRAHLALQALLDIGARRWSSGYDKTRVLTSDLTVRTRQRLAQRFRLR